MRNYHPNGTPGQLLEITLQEDETVSALLASLDIPDRYLRRAVVFRGDDQIAPDQVLADGDQLHLMLPSAGGSSGFRSLQGE